MPCGIPLTLKINDTDMSWFIIIAVMLLSLVVQQTLQRRFAKYSQVSAPMSGKEVAEKMLRDNGIYDVAVCSVSAASPAANVSSGLISPEWSRTPAFHSRSL